MPVARSQLVTVRRPWAKSSPATRGSSRQAWRRCRTWLRAVTHEDTSAGNLHVTILGSPVGDGGWLSTAMLAGEPLRAYPALRTVPVDKSDFRESAIS